MTLEVTHNPALARYEAHLDGVLAGFAEYSLGTDLIVFPHTEVKPAFEGHGVGSAIIGFALDDVRANQPEREVLPLCPFVQGWIQRHPDYADLVYRGGKP